MSEIAGYLLTKKEEEACITLIKEMREKKMTLKTKSTVSFEEDERKILQTASDLILALLREMKHHDASWAIDHSGGIWHAENEIEDFILFCSHLANCDYSNPLEIE